MNSKQGDRPLQSVYQVGNATIDIASRQILFDGTPAEDQPKILDLIVYLIENRDRVVAKDQLFDEICPSVVLVGSASLTQLIKRACDLFRQNKIGTDLFIFDK